MQHIPCNCPGQASVLKVDNLYDRGVFLSTENEGTFTKFLTDLKQAWQVKISTGSLPGINYDRYIKIILRNY